MKKRLLFVFFCSILLCLSVSAFAAEGEEPVLNIYCQQYHYHQKQKYRLV